MNKPSILLFFHIAIFWILAGCDIAQTDSGKEAAENVTDATNVSRDQTYKEGTDYILFERIRILDKAAFAEPAEAYSLLLPKGWEQESNIIWNMPGSSCTGTFRELQAASADKKYSFRLFPDILYSWNTNPELMQFYQNNSSGSPYCTNGQPMNAEQYLKNVFGPEELGNPQILKVEANPLVIQEMQQANEKTRRELMQYGSADIGFNQSAINATVRWPDGKEGIIVFGVTTIENRVPNIYNGTSDQIYTTQVMKRIVFTYPNTESKEAVNQFAVIMGSFRTNPLWSQTVENFWKNVRQQKQIEHIGKLQLMDAQTKAIGEAAIQKGAARLKSMDMNLRSWEQKQNVQDRMHTNFIKTIREVENYQDANGTIELTSGYEQAWSRGDGSTFIMSNTPDFNPATIFQDQNWKEMQKVE